MTVAAESRADLIERYEKLDALGSLVDSMASHVRAAGFDPRTVELFDVTDGTYSAIDLTVELWPDDEGEHSTEGPEFDAATARALQRKAEICAELAGPFGQEFLIREAMDSAARAARLAARLSHEEGGDDAA